MVTDAQAYWLNRKRRQKRNLSEGVGAPKLAIAYLGEEWNGLAIDFTDDSYAIRTSGGAEAYLSVLPSTPQDGLAIDFTDDTYAIRS